MSRRHITSALAELPLVVSVYSSMETRIFWPILIYLTGEDGGDVLWGMCRAERLFSHHAKIFWASGLVVR